MKFKDKLIDILAEQGKSLWQMEIDVGVAKSTIYRGVRYKSTLAAIAYYTGMRVEDLIEGTEMIDVWYG